MKEEMFSYDEPKQKREKQTDEEKKEKQRAYAKAWYERKNAGLKKENPKNGKPGKKKSPLKAEHASLTFLFFVHDDQEYTEAVSNENAQTRAQEIFLDEDYEGLQQIYFMKPLKVYNRPVMEVIDL